MPSSLEAALQALQSPDALRPESLSGLSDMDAAATALARNLWPTLPLERRQEAMRLCGELALEHIELNFDRLAVIGLSDSDPSVRARAIANLWESEDLALLPRLIGLLREDPDAVVRCEAASALGRFVLLLEETEADDQRRRALEDGLLAAAADPDVELRLHALESLGYSSRDEIPALIQEAYAADERSRRSALLAMGRSGDRRWRAQVEADLRHPSPVIRREAARAAGELELRPAVAELVDLLDDVDPEVQLQAVWALGQIGGKVAERALLHLLESAGDDPLSAAVDEALQHLAFLEGTRDIDATLRRQRSAE